MESINLFDLYAKITLDTGEYESGLDGAAEKTSSFGSKLASGLETAAKVAGAALGAAATGIAALATQSIQSYAEYEQLVGGVKTLFEDLSWDVEQNAANAYKTAGLSANEYMETAMSFAASLNQSLVETEGNIARSAELTDRAITDMADNANKMGSSMESLQNAYSGFAKQNYTMLDNLKLGYGGTKEEMERLLEDAEAFKASMGEIVDYDINNFSDIVEAIGAIQDKMGITGTTAAEAGETIQGSIAAMKGAWENFLTGMADPEQDFDALVGNLVDSVITVGDNLIPRIVELAPRLTEGLSALVNSALPQIPVLLDTLLPTLISSASSLLASFTSLLPSILTTALSALPSLVSAAVTITTNLIGALIDAAPLLLETGVTLLGELTTGILDGLPGMIEQLPQIIDGFISFIEDNLGPIFSEGITLLTEFAFGIIAAIPDLVAQLPEIISSITTFFVENFPLILEKGGELLGQLIAGILGAIGEIAVNLPAVITAIVEALDAGWDAIKEAGASLMEGLWNGLQSKIGWLKERVGGIIASVKDIFGGSNDSSGHGYSGSLGSHAGGLDYVPYNGYMAQLHRGEMVLTASEAEDYRSGAINRSLNALTGAILANSGGGGVYEINVNIDGESAARVLFDPLKAVVVQRGEALA